MAHSNRPAGAQSRARSFDHAILGQASVSGAILIAVLAALAGSCIVCLAVGLQTPESLKARLDAMAPGGVAREFPLARVAAMRIRALVAAGLALIMAVILLSNRQRFFSLCGRVSAGLGAGLRWAVEQGRAIVPQVAAATAVGCALRLYFLRQPIRLDEATTYVEFASKPLLFGISYYPAPNNHIFHTVLVHFVTLVFGGEPWSIRMVAFLAGVLMIPAAALAAIVLKGKEAALPAAALVAVSWPWVFYSTNARGYSMAGLMFLILIPICSRLRVQDDKTAWVWFVILASLGLFTVPIMAYALVPAGLWIVLSRASAWKELAIATACTLALTLVLYGPAITASGFASMATPEMIPSQHAMVPRVAQYAADLWSNWHQDLPTWAIVVFLLAAAIGWRSGSLAVLGLGWFAVALAMYPVMPYTRVWLWLSLPWLLLVASGLGVVLPPRRITSVVIILLTSWQAARVATSGSILRARETGKFRDAAQAARYMRRR